VGRIDQFLSTFAPRDAQGNHALQVRAVLRDMGLQSDIFAMDVWPELRREARSHQEYRGGAGHLLYQLSTGSPVADFLRARPEPKVVNYHNLTPISMFAPWEPHMGAELIAGRRQLQELASSTALGIGVSSYNRLELDAAGYAKTTVVPLLLDLATFDREPDRRTLDRLWADRGATWLFVGRLAPNKAQHDLVAALDVYRRVYDPDARLRLVGGASSPRYADAVRGFAAELGLAHAVELTDHVSDEELSAHYRAADVFVSTSDHEGFGVPLLEAMHHKLPVVAYGSSAVPETVGGAGLVLADKAPTTVAAAVHRVLTDDALRHALGEAAGHRLAEFALPRTRAAFQAAIETLL
jgi:glycosyltransferase involved in cell wall biosynthesis